MFSTLKQIDLDGVKGLLRSFLCF